jgi:5-carboxymethyl-2-hydroxymuconic-semialdehyde dehydrogenase
MNTSMQPVIDQVRRKVASGTLKHYINGAFVAGVRGEVFETLEPSNNQVLARVYRGHAEDIDHAAQAAKKAFSPAKNANATCCGLPTL